MPPYAPMRPNPASEPGRSGNGAAGSETRSAQQPPAPPRAQTPPAQWELWLRPLGYLLIGCLWLVLLAAALALPLLLPLGLRADNPDYTTAGFFQGLDLFVGVLAGLFGLVFLAPLFGYAFLALPLATAPLAILSFTYVVRSLQRRYRQERLSATGWSREALGPITLFPMALSLIPQRATRWSRFWLGAALMGWVPSLGMLWAAFACGIGYFLTVGWLMWPLHSTAAVVVWTVVSVLFGLATVLLVVRAAVRRFNPARPGSAAAPES